MYVDRRTARFVAPAATYVLLYSLLPHKELRFIIYVFPLFNIASAAACSYVFIRRTKAPIYELLFWGSVLVVVGNMILSTAFALVAMTNYPGGVAITRFHKLLKNEPYVNVHICNLAAQTGVTRFTQLNANWSYSKLENLQPDQLQQYSHLLVEAKTKYAPSVKVFSQTHVILDSIDTFSQIGINYKFVPPIRIKTRPAIFILEKKGFRDDIRSQDVQTIDSSQMSAEDESQEVGYEESPSTENVKVDVSDNLDESMEEKNENDIEATTNEADKGDELNSKRKGEEELPQAKKALDELKILRQQKKQRAINKIKSETRKEVVASAKEKLKEIMKRHKHVAEELLENVVSEDKEKEQEPEKDGRGDIPDTEMETEIEDDIMTQVEHENVENLNVVDTGNLNVSNEIFHRTNENIDEIVEEVISRLIDRKIYDDKTKPEDIKAEDRKMIQRIVEEVLSERINYTKVDNN